MLIKELIDDPVGIAELSAHVRKLVKMYPGEDFEHMKHNSIYDYVSKYSDWVARLYSDNSGIRIVPDKEIPDCVFVGDLNCQIIIESITIHKPKSDRVIDKVNWFFGLCDNAEQALAEFKKFLSKSKEYEQRSYIFLLSPIYRASQPEYGGFRYHKWGPYVGVQKPEHEYLYDDKHIDLVYFYRVYQIA